MKFKNLEGKTIDLEPGVGWARIAALSIAGFLAAGSALSYGYVTTQDMSPYSRPVTDKLSAELGRKVRVNGPVRVSLWPSPYVQVSDLTISGSTKKSSPIAFQAKSAQADLELSRLFPPQISVKRLTIAGAEASPSDWTLAERANPPIDAKLLGLSGIKSEGGLPVTYRFDPTDIVVTDLSLEMRAMTAGPARFDRLAVHKRPDRSAVFTAFWVYDQKEMAAKGELTSLRDAIAGNDFEFEALGKVPGMSLRAGGTASLKDRGNFVGSIDGSIVDWTTVADLFSFEYVPTAETAFELEFDGDLDSGKVQGTFNKLGTGDLTVDLELSRVDGLTVIGSLHADKLDIDAFELQPTKLPSGRLFSDKPLPLDLLRAVQVDVQLETKETRLKGEHLGELSASLWADNGVIALGPAELRMGQGSVFTDATLDVRNEPRLMTTLRVDAASPKMLEWVGLENQYKDGRLDLAVELYGSGQSLGEMAAGAHGQFNLLAGTRGVAQSSTAWLQKVLFLGFEPSAGDVVSAVATDRPAAPSCLVSRFDIEEGMAYSKVLMVDTGLATTAGSGTINLATERIDLDLHPRPRDPMRIKDARDLTVQGPLRSPRVETVKKEQRRGIARSTGQLNLAQGPNTLMPLLPTTAIVANPCIRAVLGETALAELTETVALGEIEVLAEPAP